MAVSHVKSNPVANMTGTVTVFNSAGVTTTAAATDLVRPLDWNSAHNQFMTIGGNIGANSTASGTNIVFQAAGNISLFASTDTLIFSGSQSAFVLSNSNGLSFGTNGSTVTASHNGLTSQSNQAYSAGNGSAAFQTLTFADSNGVSFSTGTQGLIATVRTNYAANDHSHGSPTLALTNLNGTTASNSAGLTLSLSAAAQSVQPVAVSGQNGSYAFSTLSFSNANGISFGTSGASAITASHNGLTSQSNQAVSGSNGSFTFQTVTFGALNGLTFYTSNGSLVGSHNGLTTARASNDAVGLNTAQTNVTWTVNSSGISLNAAGYAGTATTFNGTNVSGSMTLNSAGLRLDLSAGAGGGVNPAASASNGSFAFTTLNFSNANNVTFGTSVGGIITASVAAPGAAAEQNAINLLGANTAGNTTATGSTIGLSGLNLTLSGTNASQVVISAPATSSLVAAADISISTNGSTITISRTQSTQSGWNPYADQLYIADTIGNGTLRMEPMGYFPNVQYDRLLIPVVNTNSSNSSGSHTLSFWVGLYSRNGSTLSLASSTSASTALTHSGTQGSYSLYSGMRFFTIGSTNTINGGQWWLGFLSRTTSGGTNGSYSNILVSGLATAFQGFFGSSNNTTQQWTLGQGVYTATTSGMPGSVAFSELRGSDSGLNRAPYIMFASSTI